MNARERFTQTMLFGTPDRIPYRFGGPRQSTMEAWYRQGLPRDVNFSALVGSDRESHLPINLGPVPPFEEVVLEETKYHKIWIDNLGAKRIDHKVLPTPGFVTRKWLEFPVKNRQDFLEMTKRYDPSTPARYRADWAERVPQWQTRDYTLGHTIFSMFWRVRDWVGFEGLCTMCYDQPKLVHEMMDYVVDFTIEALDRGYSDAAPDYVYFSEDMAYKTASMISPAMVREFMEPGYRRLVQFCRDKGVPVIIMDCDGYNGQLIPIWIDVGINAASPIEIAAHNDPVLYRKQYGKHIAMLGAIDKRELRFDKPRVKREVMSKVPWLVEQGGYIPGVDHGVPPDVPVRNFLYMCELIKGIANGKDTGSWEPSCELEQQLGPIEEMWTPDMALPVADEEEGS